MLLLSEILENAKRLKIIAIVSECFISHTTYFTYFTYTVYFISVSQNYFYKKGEKHIKDL